MEELDAVQRSDGGFRAAPKLRALFAAEQQKLQVGNATLQYQPPKLPRQPPPTSVGSTKLDPPSDASTLSSSKQMLYSVALSQVVYILPSGRQENYGSAGIAILEGDPHERQPPHVVLYGSSKSPESPLVDLSITDKIHLVPDIDCWATLETKGQNSRLQFRSTEEWIGFARAFVCARSHAHGSSSAIMLQDVTVPKDFLRKIEDGDMVQLMYKMHLQKPWPPDALGPLLRETSGNGFKLEIGSGLAPLGLEDGIKGMQKGGRRFIVLHEVPEQGLKDAVILYDITVSRIRKRKLLKEAGDGSLDMSVKHGNESARNIGSVEDRETVYNTSAAPTAEGERNNESVLNRIARMSRAGAAVDLHLFGIPRATRVEDRPEISTTYSSNEALGLHTVEEKNVNVESVGNEKLIGKNDDEAEERGNVPEPHTDLGLRNEGSYDHLELLEDIKQSQTCIYAAVTELSSKIELLVNTKSQKPEKLDLGALDFMDGDAQEDSLVESVARMIAENRELKRRLPETRSQKAALLSPNTEEKPGKGMEGMDSETSAGFEVVPVQQDVIEEPEQVPKLILDCNTMRQKIEEIMLGIYHDLGLELQEYLEPATSTKVLSSLRQKLTAATSATVAVMQEELAVFATANHSTAMQLLEGRDPAVDFEE